MKFKRSLKTLTLSSSNTNFTKMKKFNILLFFDKNVFGLKIVFAQSEVVTVAGLLHREPCIFWSWWH